MKVIRVSEIEQTKAWQELIQYLRDGGEAEAFSLFATAQLNRKHTFVPIERVDLGTNAYYLTFDAGVVKIASGRDLLNDVAVQVAIANWNSVKVIQVSDIPKNDAWNGIITYLQSGEVKDAHRLYVAAQKSCKQDAVPVQNAKLRKNTRYLVLARDGLFFAIGRTLLDHDSVKLAIATHESREQDTVGLAVATYHVRRILKEEEEIVQDEDSDAKVVCKLCKKRRRRGVTAYGTICDLCHEAALENDYPGVLEAATRKLIHTVQSEMGQPYNHWSDEMVDGVQNEHGEWFMHRIRLYYAAEIVEQRKSPPPAKKTTPEPESLHYSSHVPKFKADYDYPRGIARFWLFKEQKAFYDTVAAGLDAREIPDVQEQYDYVYHYARKLVMKWTSNRELPELHAKLTELTEAYPNAAELIQAVAEWKAETKRAYRDAYLSQLVGTGTCRNAKILVSSWGADRYLHELHDELLELAETQAHDQQFITRCLYWRFNCLLGLGRYEEFLESSSAARATITRTPVGTRSMRLLVQWHLGENADPVDLVAAARAPLNPSSLDNWDQFTKQLTNVFAENAAQNGAWFERLLRAYKDEKGHAALARPVNCDTGFVYQIPRTIFDSNLVDPIDELEGAFDCPSSEDVKPVRSLANEIRACSRVAENRLRDELGLPQVGAGWVAETKLFQAIADAFPETTVIHHGQPWWLGLQHFDIWLPDWKIAVEYHGLQHFQPVEFFGGEDVFIATQERDERKVCLAKENAVELIVATEETPTETVIELIRQHRGETKSQQ